MKEIEEKKSKKEKDIPLATMVIKEYRELNNSYIKTNKKLTNIIIILLVFLSIATTYIVFWHPHKGIIQYEVCE